VSVPPTGGGLVAQNFLSCDRDQELLLPPSLWEWLPEDHLAWFVLDAVDRVAGGSALIKVRSVRGA
jgi:hypothetical protein